MSAHVCLGNHTCPPSLPQVSDALAATNLSDPQTQKSLAVFTTAMLALLLFAARQRIAAGGQHADAGDEASDGEAGSDTDAAAGGAGWAGLTLEERQAEAARRITAAKQRIVEVKQQQDQQAKAAELAALVAAQEAAAKAAAAQSALEAAAADQDSPAALEVAEAAVAEAEAAALVDMEVIAEGGSIGKLTTDAAAARVIADQGAAAAAAAERELQQAQQLLAQQWAAAPAASDDAAALPGKMTADASVAAAAALPGKMTADASAAAAMAAPSLERPGGRGRDTAEAATALPKAVPVSQPSLERPGGRGGREALDAALAQDAAPLVDPALARPGGRGRETPAAASPAASASSGGGKRWDPLSILLAPAAPLLAGLFGGAGSTAAPGRNKYDMLLDVLSSAAAAPDARVGGRLGSTGRSLRPRPTQSSRALRTMRSCLRRAVAPRPRLQADSRYDPVRSLLAATPSSGVPRYDFARSLLRGMAGADGAGDSPFDMARSLLQVRVPCPASRMQPRSTRQPLPQCQCQRACAACRCRCWGPLPPTLLLPALQSMEPTGGSKFDPVWGLLKEATMLQVGAAGAGGRHLGCCCSTGSCALAGSRPPWLESQHNTLPLLPAARRPAHLPPPSFPFLSPAAGVGQLQV